mmetsp:Transcript_48908/g.71718  ORF Transcript_48908/g.71718 Transcript_48908/m.71718 type:complete len:106 (-) Transcript_48908:119-436(-)
MSIDMSMFVTFTCCAVCIPSSQKKPKIVPDFEKNVTNIFLTFFLDLVVTLTCRVHTIPKSGKMRMFFFVCLMCMYVYMDMPVYIHVLICKYKYACMYARFMYVCV